MKLFEFFHEYGDDSTIISKLQSISLLRTELRCSLCNEPSGRRKINTTDKIMFECAKRSCRCAKSIRTDSFFENTRLKLTDCMLFLHLWSRGYTEKLICEYFSFSKKQWLTDPVFAATYAFTISKRTIV